MSTNGATERISRARQAVGELIDIVYGEGPGTEQWYRMLLDIRDTLAHSELAEERVLADAAAMFDALYAGPRNFSEFYVSRPDEAERLTANRRLSQVVDRLAGALHTA